MDSVTETFKQIETRDERLPSRHLLNLLYLFYGVFFLMNFMGMPQLKYVYLIICGLSFLTILTSSFQGAVLSLIPFLIIEGQGRVVWGYHFSVRLVFDFFLALTMLRLFIRERRILAIDRIPKALNILIIFHMAWWTFELTNTLGAGVLPGVATSKFYLYPFLFFYAVSHSKIDLFSDRNKYLLRLIFGVLLAEIALTIFQKFQGEAFLYSISPHYEALFEKYENFQGRFFRPWGTTFTPGGPSSLFYLALPFILYLNKQRVSGFFIGFKWVGIILLHISICVALFLCDTRSATIKYVLILMGVSCLSIYGSKLRLRKTAGVFWGAIVFGMFISLSVFNLDKIESLVDIEYTKNRFTHLMDAKKVKRSRPGPYAQFKVVMNETEWPLGYGPGMLTTVLPHFEARREQIKHLSPYGFWNHDSVIVHVFLELGIGGFFMATMLFIIPLYLWRFAIKLYFKEDYEAFSMVSMGAVFTSIILIGSFASANFLSNPDSFFYWLFVGASFNSYYLSVKDSDEVKTADLRMAIKAS